MRSLEERAKSAEQRWNMARAKKRINRMSPGIIKPKTEWEFLQDGTRARLDVNGYYRDQNNNLVHRQIYKEFHGEIPDGWIVHHLNFFKISNQIDNLIALPDKLHDHIHETMRREDRIMGRPEVIRELIAYRDRFIDSDPKFELTRLMKSHGEIIRRYNELQVEVGLHRMEAPIIMAGLAHIDRLKDLKPSKNPKSSKVNYRAIYKKHHGIIPSGWVVHHVDGDHGNNDIENLIGLPEAFHNKLNSMMRRRGRHSYPRNAITGMLKRWLETGPVEPIELPRARVSTPRTIIRRRVDLNVKSV